MSEMMYSNFINRYPVSKTLRFELIPQGKTLDYIEERGLLKEDELRAEAYKKVKVIIDEYHKDFIERALEKVELKSLPEYLDVYLKGGNNTDQLKTIGEKLRKEIVKAFTSMPEYTSLDKKDLIEKILPEYVGSDTTKLGLLRQFSRFTTYFTGFHENRKNMYSAEEKSTAISYRIINQNLPKFIDNSINLSKAMMYPDIASSIDTFKKEMPVLFKQETILDEMSVSNYDAFITQKGIDRYNQIIGGKSNSDKSKIQGINEIINLHNQKAKQNEKVGKLKPLYKQILSDRTTLSFIPDAFDDHADEDVIDAIVATHDSLEETLKRISALLEELPYYRIDKIYIRNDASLTRISQDVYGSWNYINEKLIEKYDLEHTEKEKKNTEKYIEKRRKDLKKEKSISLAQIEAICGDAKVKEWLTDAFRKSIFERIETAYKDLSHVMIKRDLGSSIRKNKKMVACIKSYLDSLKELQNGVKPLLGEGTETDKDNSFYGDLEISWQELDIITPLYNKVRNYMTKRPYSTEKMKLNFQNSTLLDGWDLNKERDNGAVLFRKGNCYYLGIMSKGNNKLFLDVPESNENGYEKMEYKLLPGANKMLPKVFFSKSRIDEFAPSAELIEKYKKETHKKGPNFNIDDCRKLIDFFKESIEKHEEWRKFGFNFSATETYEDLSGFYREVEAQGYKISFKNISEEIINRFVENGELYLFQIYNKDFSKSSKGVPNLHTLYWHMLFDDENLKKPIYKLNGQAEIFYRKASITPKETVIHKANIPIANKNKLNGKSQTTFEYDIIKDKRYTLDKFQFHVPITMNFSANNRTTLNEIVKDAIKRNNRNYVIGIDRGERHLLYVSVIDSDGRIVEQRTLNQIVANYNGIEMPAVDYHALLEEKEKVRDEERKNWQSIESIKQLKEGYLSQVVHYIANLMVKYNAILVMEDLNSGFKRSRQKVEKQVYQNFEKMLINKLNYLVDKKLPANEKGGLRNAYQLTNRFESFQKIGKQSGTVFYVEAWNTSKIDPTTGFVNLFDTRYKSVDAAIEMWNAFDSIEFDEDKDLFAFTFNYDKFPRGSQDYQKNWTIYSNGERIQSFKNANGKWETKTINLTEAFKRLLVTQDIDYKNDSVKEAILLIKDKSFHKEFLSLFALLVQLRNSRAGTDEDYIISPVPNASGDFYDSRCANEKLPQDADANGAYNIARKGLMIIKRIKNAKDGEKIDCLIRNKEWLEFAQTVTF